MKINLDIGAPGQEKIRGEFVQRMVAKSIDMTIALCLWQIPGGAGFVASIMFILIADGFMEGLSPGKYLSGLKVMRLDGEPVDYLSSILRNIPVSLPFFFYSIPAVGHFLAYTLGIGALFVEAYFCLYNDDGMRVGDTIASTGVIISKDLETDQADS